MLPGYNQGSFILFWCAARSDALDCTALYDTLQHKLQHTATHCNAQYVLVHHEIGCHGLHPDGHSTAYCNTHSNTLQHTATHTVFWCTPRSVELHHQERSTAHCNHTATTLQPHCNTLQRTTTHCNALQHTATRCKHTATHTILWCTASSDCITSGAELHRVPKQTATQTAIHNLF